MRGAADQVKRITLELGGKSANIVFADSDLETAAATAPYGVFDNAGQDCCARSRILVQRSVFDRFMELLEPAVKGVVVADPGDEATEMGPLISAGQRETVRSYVEDATEDVDVAFRGEAPDGRRLLVPADGGAAEGHDRPGLAGGGLRPGRGRDAVRRRGRRGREGQRHGIRAVGVDLDARRGARPARRPRRRGRQPVGQLAQQRPLLHPVRRLQAVGDRPRARTGRAGRLHRRQERLHLTPTAAPRTPERTSHGRQARRARWPSSPAGAAASVSRPCAGSPQEGAKVVVGDLDDAAGEALADGDRRRVRALRRRRARTTSTALFATAKEQFGRVDIAFNNAGISPPEDDSILDTDLDAWRRVQEVNLTSVYLCCKAALPYMLEQGRARSSTPRRSSR